MIKYILCVVTSVWNVPQTAKAYTSASNKPLQADAETTIATLAGPTGVLAVCTASGKPEPDYDPLWAVRAFVTLFPNGCGQAPRGTTIEYWLRVLLKRSDRRFAENSLFVLSMYDVITRHKTNTSAWIQHRMSSEQVTSIGRLSERQFQLVMVMLKAGYRGAALQTALAQSDPGAILVFNDKSDDKIVITLRIPTAYALANTQQ